MISSMTHKNVELKNKRFTNLLNVSLP